MAQKFVFLWYVNYVSMCLRRQAANELSGPRCAHDSEQAAFLTGAFVLFALDGGHYSFPSIVVQSQSYASCSSPTNYIGHCTHSINSTAGSLVPGIA